MTVHPAYSAIILQSFYDVANMSLSTNYLVSSQDILPIEPLNLTLPDENVESLIARDDQLKFSLRKIEKAINGSQEIFFSDSDRLVKQMIREMAQQRTSFPDFYAPGTYLLAGAYLIAIILLLFIIVLRRKYHALAMILMSSSETHRTNAVRIRTAAPTTQIPVTPAPIVQWLETLQSHEQAIICALIVIVLIIIALMICIRRSFRRRAYVYIDVESEREMQQIQLYQFPNRNRTYALRLPPVPTRLILRSVKLFGILVIDTPKWYMIHQFTGHQIDLPKIILISPTKLRSMQRILASDNYRVRPAIIYSYEQNILEPTAQDNAGLRAEAPPQYV